MSMILALGYELYFDSGVNPFVLRLLILYAVSFGVGGCFIKYRNFIQFKEEEFFVTINGETRTISLENLVGEIKKEGAPVPHNVLKVKVGESWVLFRGFKVKELLEFLEKNGAAVKIINKT